LIFFSVLLGAVKDFHPIVALIGAFGVFTQTPPIVAFVGFENIVSLLVSRVFHPILACIVYLSLRIFHISCVLIDCLNLSLSPTHPILASCS
jgi:hypothetical protein